MVGLDFTESRHLGAQRLTKLVGLDHLVSFRHGNALAMPFDDASFDVVIGQEAWCHVPDKPRLIAECARVVKPGGTIGFTDILRRPALSDAELTRLARGMPFPTLESLEGYAGLLEAKRLRSPAARRFERRLGAHPRATPGDVSGVEGRDGAQIRRRALPQVGRHVRLLRRAVSGGQARRRQVRGAAVA